MTALFTLLYRLAFVALVAMILGLGSAWVMVSGGTRLSMEKLGPWQTWPTAGRVDQDPYTRAHTIRSGLLPINANLGVTYRAAHDTEGRRLVSSCEYAIESDGLDANWWSLGVFKEQGWLIANPAERYAFNAASAVLEPNGALVITLSRDARPGNWLPTGGGGNLVVEFSVLDARWAQPGPDQDRVRAMPTIRRVGCR